MRLAGGVLHLLVVLLPPLFLGLLGTSLTDAATLLFLAAISALYLGDAATMRRSRLDAVIASDDNARYERWALVTGCTLLALFWVLIVERAMTLRSAVWVQATGTVMLGAGVALRTLAVRTLGNAFRTELDVPGETPLETHGVYRYLRHPSEAGLVLAVLGSILLLQSYAGLVLWSAGLLPLTLLRLSLEQTALERRFGVVYLSYASEVGGLLPRRRVSPIDSGKNPLPNS